MKFSCWNVNGIRAVAGKGFGDWFSSTHADVISLQEVKAFQDQVDPKVVNVDGYRCFWNAAKKPGYSGTATWTRIEPLDYRTGLGIPVCDEEGRTQIFEFKDYFYLNCYFPNSQPERARMKEKLAYCSEIKKFCESMALKKGVIVAGDYNVAHTPLDIKNAKSNEDSPGFTQEERDWMTSFLVGGTDQNSVMRDVFRERNPGAAGLYTWWSYRAGARGKNVGWRIDYQTVSAGLLDRVIDVDHERQVMGSDHCPIYLRLKN